jgi:hypothetical protein
VSALSAAAAATAAAGRQFSNSCGPLARPSNYGALGPIDQLEGAAASRSIAAPNAPGLRLPRPFSVSQASFFTRAPPLTFRTYTGVSGESPYASDFSLSSPAKIQRNLETPNERTWTECRLQRRAHSLFNHSRPLAAVSAPRGLARPVDRRRILDGPPVYCASCRAIGPDGTTGRLPLPVPSLA